MTDTFRDVSEEWERNLRKMDAEIENLHAATENLQTLTKKARWETRWQPFVAFTGIATAGYAFVEFIFMKFS